MAGCSYPAWWPHRSSCIPSTAGFSRRSLPAACAHDLRGHQRSAAKSAFQLERCGCNRGDARAGVGGFSRGRDECRQRPGAGIRASLIGVNHLEGHIYSAWVYPADARSAPIEPQFPLLALLVSGGHTELNLITGHLQYRRLGSTLDDAAGEAFDKVARLLGLPYPGGPSVQKAAQNGNAEAFNFPARALGRDVEFLLQRAENRCSAFGA